MSPTQAARMAFVAAILYAGLLQAQNVEEPLALGGQGGSSIEGRIDWTNSRIVAYGEGVAPDAIVNPGQRRLLGLRAARAVAYRNLLELVGQVRIDAETRVDRAMVASDSVRLRVSGLVRGARVVRGSEKEVDGVYRVAVELRMLGSLADAVLPGAAGERPASPSGTEGAPPFVPPQPYTGLVVDARGLGLQPSMSPRLVTQSGRVVYSATFADRSYAVRTGVVGYCADQGRALASDRVGRAGERQPLVVRAVDVVGAYRADPVLSTEDAVRVAMADAQSHFLSQCRVVFLVGPAAPAGPDSTGASIPHPAR